MKILKNTLLLLLVSSTLIAQTGWTDHTRILPDTLRKVPVAISVFHDPNPNYPIFNDEKDEYDSKYLWKHSTFVRSEMEDLEVVSAGSFIWFSEKGWFANVQYTKTDFSDRFKCKNGILKKGKTYVFKKNYRYGDNLYGGDALWYVLAKDKNGKIYKGIGIIETEGEFKK